MELSMALMRQIAGLFIMAACGIALVRLNVIQRDECHVLSKLGVYLFSPCLVFSGFLIELTPERSQGLLIAFVLAIVIHLFFILLIRINQKMGCRSGMDNASVLISNAGNIVIPLVVGTIGRDYILYAAPYLIVQNMITWTYGVKLISGEKKFNWKKIVKNPTLCMILIGFILLFTGINLPKELSSTIESLGNCMPPLSMILIGISIADIKKEKWKEGMSTLPVIFERLIVFPALTLILVFILNVVYPMEAIWKIVFVVMLGAAGPSAALVPQIAELYGKDTERASYINLLSTMFCIVTLPIVTYVLQAVL